MTLQPAGLVLALTTFTTIAAGHVLVRRMHARFSTRPALPLFVFGVLIFIGSLTAHSDLLSAVLGLTSITVIWDGIEIFRQERRMQREQIRD